METPVLIPIALPTTTLQRSFFAPSDDTLFDREPFLERGGILTAINAREDAQRDCAPRCVSGFYEQETTGPIIISDEALTRRNSILPRIRCRAR